MNQQMAGLRKGIIGPFDSVHVVQHIYAAARTLSLVMIACCANRRVRVPIVKGYIDRTEECLPGFFKSTKAIDFNNPGQFQESLEQLMESIYR